MVSVKNGFTLIELIFAIVIIALSVLALPMMIQSTSNANASNLVEEAIFAASAELNDIVATHWDENSMFDTPNSLARVIDTDNNCSNHLRQGHINQPLHRRCLNESAIKPKDAAQNNTIYALEDLAHTSENIFATESVSAQGYKKEYNSTITIIRPAIFGAKSYDDMKEIQLRVIDAHNGKLITLLKTFSANIGEVDYFKKAY